MKRAISIVLCIFFVTALFGCYARQDGRDNVGGFFSALGDYMRADRDGDESAAPDEASAESPLSSPPSESPAAASPSASPSPSVQPSAQPPAPEPSATSAAPEPSATSAAPEPSSTSAAPDEPGTSGFFESGRLPFKFTAKDLYGNTVTEASLGDKQLFFVHYWATWCGPCLQEMPDLAQLATDFNDSVGFIALLDDYGSNLSGAIQIVESTGIPANFIMVDAASAEVAGLMSLVASGYLPTSAIIDASGVMVIDQLVGAYGDFYATALDYLLTYGPDRLGER